MKENKLIQFISTTPQELESSILKGVSIMIEELKEDFSSKAQTEFLSRKEVCDLLKISLTTLWKYTKQGKLSSKGIGNRVLYDRKIIENALVELKPHHSKAANSNDKKLGSW